MYKKRIIDSHMHLWDLKNPGYEWLNVEDPFFRANKMRKNFLLEDYKSLSKGFHIEKVVHVQCGGFPEDPVKESEWIQQLADKSDLIGAMVGFADFNSDQIDEQLARHKNYSLMRGIRSLVAYHENLPLNIFSQKPHILRDEKWRQGYSLLGKYNLSADLLIYGSQLTEAYEHLKDFPDIPVVINHLAWPVDLSDKGIEMWKEDLWLLASLPYVYIKLSSLGGIFQKASHKKIQPVLKEIILAFGVDRVMFGSNVPPCACYFSFSDLVHPIEKACETLSEEVHDKVFAANAEKFYQIVSRESPV